MDTTTVTPDIEAQKFLAYRREKKQKLRDDLLVLYNSENYAKISLDDVVLPVLKSPIFDELYQTRNDDHGQAESTSREVLSSGSVE